MKRSHGRLLCLKGLRAAQLPALNATPDVLAPFLTSLLHEAVPFVDSVAPKASAAGQRAATAAWRRKGSKSAHAGSAARVELYQRTVDEGEGRGDSARETWVCRRSVHRDAAARGTASWAEFRDCFKERHVETEGSFTPTVVDAREVVRWDCTGVVCCHL